MTASIDRIASRYRHRRHREYVRYKLRMDPSFVALAGILAGSTRPLLDVGCGMGLLGFYLREHGFKGRYLGLDADATKVDEAHRIANAHDSDLAFEVGNATALPAFKGDVVLIDVLHYLSGSEQGGLLAAAAGRVEADGVLVARNVLREANWRFHATVIEERFCHAVRWMRTGARHFPTRTQIEQPLRTAGMTVQTRPLWGCTPFNSYLIVGRKAGHPAIDAT